MFWPEEWKALFFSKISAVQLHLAYSERPLKVVKNKRNFTQEAVFAPICANQFFADTNESFRRI